MMRWRRLHERINASMYRDGVQPSREVKHQRLLMERCLQPHPDGQIYRWRGLLPHSRLKPYERKTPLKPDAWGEGAVGALQWTFDCPHGRGLAERLRARILAKRAELEASRASRMTIFRWFLAELRQPMHDHR
ncbi:hypothetical protein FSB08_34415 [Paraburkholderia sp. JPY432]|nr:hypothetical protein [Paraburkholderia youngii]